MSDGLLALTWRLTVETLAEMKNPAAVAFVRQANIANGPQSVNDGVDGLHAREIENRQSELLEGEHGERLTSERHARQAQLIRRWKPWGHHAAMTCESIAPKVAQRSLILRVVARGQEAGVRTPNRTQ
jgi:hypothetical protein